MKKYTISIILVSFLVFFPVLSMAQTGANQNPNPTAANQNLRGTLDNPFGTSGPQNLMDLFAFIIDNLIIPIGAIIAVLAFIYAGFMYVRAAGDETKIKTAHNALLYASVGTAILLGAKVIIEVLKGTINLIQS